MDLSYYSDHHGINLETVVTSGLGLELTRTGASVAEYLRPRLQELYHRTPFPVTPFLNFDSAMGPWTGRSCAPYDVAPPYENLGGLDITIFKNYKLDASPTALPQVGPQHVFSKLVAPDSLISDPNALNHNRYWDANFLTIGPSRKMLMTAAERSGWSITRYHHVTLEFAYTRGASLRLWRGVLHA